MGVWGYIMMGGILCINFFVIGLGIGLGKLRNSTNHCCHCNNGCKQNHKEIEPAILGEGDKSTS